MSDQDVKRIDVCGVCCPLPLIKLAQTVNTLEPGREFEIIGNDPIFESSVRDYCAVNGHVILEVKPGEGRRLTIRIRVGGPS